MWKEKGNSSWEQNYSFKYIVKRWHSGTVMWRISKKASVKQKLYHFDVDVCKHQH